MRILDCLYGYEVSPVLWKKVTQGLSAGRVQSVATRLVVERERERMRFVAARYWDILGTFEPGAFEARSLRVDGRGSPRDATSARTSRAPRSSSSTRSAPAAGGRLRDRPFAVRSVEEKPYTRRPAAPFRTSTLQQEASRKLRFSSQTTMRVAQKLYENGYITYMRTDSVALSETALKAARAQAAEVYGAETVPERPRTYAREVANAQEAHEAIRPAGERFRTPKQVERELSRDEQALYELIWKRTIASQMKDASGQTVKIRLGATTAGGEDAEFRAAGTVITFPGFLLAYEAGRDEPADADEREGRLPQLEVGQTVEPTALEAEGHETTPPPRYTEASLVKALEDRGIGRPSTYASILGTIVDRGYVFKKGTALVPSFVAFAVTQLLEGHFGRLVDYDFTARMEDDLDRIAAGDEARVAWLQRFYFGDGTPGLHALVTDHLDEIDARAVNSIEIGDGIVLRVGRYGPYVTRGDERASVPDDLAPDELTVEKAEELLAAPSGDRSLGLHPEWEREIVVKNGRYGPYVTEVLPEGETGKPRAASLFQTMSPETVTLDEARAPALAAAHARGARRRGDPRLERPLRAVREEGQRDTLARVRGAAVHDHDRAGARAARPAEAAPRPGRAEAAAARARPDPASGKPVVLKEGRFGPYVTDGETNASLRRGDDPRPSRSSGPPSCSPSGARRDRLPSASAASGENIRATVQTFAADRRLSLRGRTRTR